MASSWICGIINVLWLGDSVGKCLIISATIANSHIYITTHTHHTTPHHTTPHHNTKYLFIIKRICMIGNEQDNISILILRSMLAVII